MLAGAADPWWLIGSAAVALHGAEVVPRDIDILLSTADAERLLPTIGVVPRSGVPDALFRSALFARWPRGDLPVEFMADLHVRDRPLRLATREMISVGDHAMFVPARAELATVLRGMGRPKDLARAALIARS